MRLILSLLIVDLLVPNLSLALGQPDKTAEELYDELAEAPDLLAGEGKPAPKEAAPKKPIVIQRGDRVEILAVDEEYIGPMPEKIPTTFIPGTHRGRFAIQQQSGRVAYCYDFEDPDKVFKDDNVMRSPQDTKVVIDNTAFLTSHATVRMVDDGVPSPTFSQASFPRFHGETLGYIGENGEGPRVYLRGQSGTISFASWGLWRHERFGQRKAGYIITEKETNPPVFRMLSENQLGPEYESIERVDYSTDHLLIYVAQKLDEQGDATGKQVVVDQQPEPWHFNLFDLTTSPDGRRYAYAVVDKTKKGDAWRIVLDGKEQPLYDSLTKESLRFSPDSNRFSYAAGRGNNRVVVVDGKEYPAFKRIYGNSLIFSPDSLHFVYAAYQGGPIWRVVLDGKPVAVHACSGIERTFFSPAGKPYYVVEKKRRDKSRPSTEALATPGQKDLIEFNEVRSPVFSPDGKQVAYIGVTNDENGKQKSAVVVHNGEPGKEYRWVRDLKFSADGERLYYFAREEGRAVLVVNGEEKEEFGLVESLVLSPDGKHWAARGWRGEKDQERDVVVVDGEVVSDLPGDLFFYSTEEVAPVFSPDGEHCAYFTKDQDWRFLVIDGKTTRPYDRFMFSGPKFVSPTRVRFYAVRDNALFRVYADVRRGSFKGEPVVTDEQVAEWVRKGKEIEEEDPIIAAGYYRKAAERGHPEAQCNLGRLYSHNKLPSANRHETAFAWLRKSGNQGFPRAEFNVGVVYEDGLGVEKNDAEALRWLRRAAEGGYPTAQANLGFRYRDGQGVSKDLAESLRWFRKAADQGHPQGLFGVAYAYEKGLRVTRDYKTAIEWYRRAAAEGNTPAMGNLGHHYQYGNGVPKNLTTAKDWYRRAARLGSNFSRKRLQELLPNTKNRRGMYPWFAQERDVGTSAGAGRDGKPSSKRNVKLEAPVAGHDKPWRVTLPVYVYGPDEIATATDEKGVLRMARLPAVRIDRFRPLSPLDSAQMEAAGGFLPIAYPPYGVQVSGLAEAPSGTAESIQRYLESFYENGGH